MYAGLKKLETNQIFSCFAEDSRNKLSNHGLEHVPADDIDETILPSRPVIYQFEWSVLDSALLSVCVHFLIQRLIGACGYRLGFSTTMSSW